MNIIKTLQEDDEIWDLFTRRVEYNSQIHDQHERRPYWASGYKNIFEPAVSRYLIEHGYHIEYPDGKPFAVCLTHDIDSVYKPKLLKGYHALRHLCGSRISDCLHSLSEIRSKKIPWWNFLDIMAIEKKYDAKSSFYFMVQDPGDLEFGYNIEDCETVIGEISDGGWEVGLHGGFCTYNDPVEIREKKKRLEKVLNKKVVGYRNHYLRFQVPDTWEYLRSAMFRYDATFGYSDCIGFRNGMCHPFKPYNINTHREIDILELPLTIMDCTLDLYMKLDLDRAWEMTKRLIDTVAECRGVITLLWHNNYLIGDNRDLYEKILKYCAEKDAWMTSGEQISTWWTDNVNP